MNNALNYEGAMSVKSLTINGFRGFSKQQTLRLAQPSNQAGTGLTILVGPNNGGKSTIIESFSVIFNRQAVSFSEGKRNKAAGDRISFSVELDTGDTYELHTIAAGGSETVRASNDQLPNICYSLPSRRFFRPYFGRSTSDRDSYMSGQTLGATGTRSNPIEEFSSRLFKVLDNIDGFNEVLAQVMNPVPEWTIEMSDQGDYYVKLNAGGQYHTTDGLGEGVVSLLFIVDALYDSEPGQLIVIDEPELSLHPAYQRRLARLFAQYAKDRQIVYATHSPYFVDFEYVLNGATVARVNRPEGHCVISQINEDTPQQLGGFLTDDHNPHVLGVDARETFFQEDGVIIVEGQEDVVFYPRILDQLVEKGLLSSRSASAMRERFFGWGAGGADKVERLLTLLRDLGYRQVAVILDRNKCDLIPPLRERFPDYFIDAIPADDVRTKPERPTQSATSGLLDEKNMLKQEFQERVSGLFTDLAHVIGVVAAQDSN